MAVNSRAMTDSTAGAAFVRAFEGAVAALVDDVAFGGVEVVLVSASAGRTHGLTVLLDREGGLDIATCERVAARINATLEAYPDAVYTLEVSSAGLERPLVRPSDYERFAGRNAKIITTVLIDKAKTHRGVLAGTRGENVVLRLAGQNDGERAIPFEAIKAANLEYDIRADLQRAKREKRG